MALYPGAQVRLLPGKSRLALDPRTATEHTMVGTLAGTESWFRSRGLVSHFGTGPRGEIRQWQDTRFRAASDLAGNPYCISTENADTGAGYPAWSGSAVPPMTTQQIEANVLLLGWICRTHRIPARMAASSCDRGIAPHRWGIDPWRRPGCPRWSGSYAKACPGDVRIAQIRAMAPRVAAITGTPSQEDDMFTAEDRQMLRELHLGRNHKRYGRDWIRDNVLPLLSQDRLTLIGIVAGRHVRDEDPDQPVDVDQLAEMVADAARQAVTEALPAALADLDAETVAAAVVDALPPELAQQVVAEIGVRLNEA